MKIITFSITLIILIQFINQVNSVKKKKSKTLHKKQDKIHKKKSIFILLLCYLKVNPYLIPEKSWKLLAALEENEIEVECFPQCESGGLCESGNCFCLHPYYGESCENSK